MIGALLCRLGWHQCSEWWPNVLQATIIHSIDPTRPETTVRHVLQSQCERCGIVVYRPRPKETRP